MKDPDLDARRRCVRRADLLLVALALVLLALAVALLLYLTAQPAAFD